MDNEQIIQVRTFFEELANYPFLLKRVGVHDLSGALEFIHSFQEEEQIFEYFLTGLIEQSKFYPTNADEWLEVARLCNYNHLAILDETVDLTEGGPVGDWYIYPKFVKWLYKNAPSAIILMLDEQDQKFLKYDIPKTGLPD